MRNLFAFVLVGLLAISGATLGSENSAFAKAKSVTIDTENGPLRGISQAGENQFLGIPYATPPVGTLRWMPPQPRGKCMGSLMRLDSEACVRNWALTRPRSSGKKTAFFSISSHQMGIPITRTNRETTGMACRSWSGFMAAV
jgi:hypothetical protein